MIFNDFNKLLLISMNFEALKLLLGILGLGLGNWAPEAGGTAGLDPGEPSGVVYMHRFFKEFSKNPLEIPKGIPS